MISHFGFSRLELHESLSKCAYNNIMAIYLLLGRYKYEVLINMKTFLFYFIVLKEKIQLFFFLFFSFPFKDK